MGPREEPAACSLSWDSGGWTAEKAGVSYKLELSECAELDVLDPAGANRYHQTSNPSAALQNRSKLNHGPPASADR